MYAVYRRPFIVPYAQCDCNEKLKLSAALKEAQQVSMEHCDQLGIGNRYLLSLNMVFLLAKIHIDITHMPRGGETLAIETVPYLPVRAIYPRVTTLYGEKEEPLMRIDSRWTLVNTQTDRILRRPPEGLPLPFTPTPQDFSDVKIAAPASLQPLEQVRVRYCNLDSNHHLNNGEYADLVCNCLEQELLEGWETAAFTILYHHEAKLGQTICLEGARQENIRYIRGTLDQGPCFESEVILQKRRE